MFSHNRRENTELFISGIFFSACFIFFYFFYDHHLFTIEQEQIFLLTPGYFLSYLSKPAILSSYAGDFLTQFFYLQGGGAVVITCLLILTWHLVKKVTEKLTGKNPGLLPLIPFISGWIGFCDIEFPAAVIVSLIITVFFTIFYISVKNRLARIPAGIIIVPFLYVTAGSYFFLFVVLAIIFENFRYGLRQSIPVTCLFLLISLMFPVCARSWYLLTTAQAFTWITGSVREPDLIHFLPFIFIVLTLVFTLIPVRKLIFLSSGRTIILQVIIALLLLSGGLLLRADFTLEKILALDYEANHSRWDKVYELSCRYRLRNNIASYFTNMALAKMGLLADELMDHYQPAVTGLFIPVNSNENYLTIAFSNEVYWQLGDVNASQHSALLGMIFSPQTRNSRLMKRLIEINIVNGEYDVAEKYINILGKTLFHRKWANDKKRFLYNDGECSRSQWIAGKRKIIPSADLLKNGNEYKKTLEMLVEANPENRMALDYLLCYDLLDKNIPSFVKGLLKHSDQVRKTVLPKVYQEALLIEIASGRRSPGDFDNFIFTPEYVRKMADYTAIFEKSNGDGQLLQKKYSNTYWFYYHFATMNPDL